MQSAFPPGSIPYKEAEWIARRVAKATNGNFHIEVFSASQLVPANLLLQALWRGIVECGQVPLDIFQSENSALVFASGVPFGPKAAGQMKWWKRGGGGGIVNRILKPWDVMAFPCGDYGKRTGGWFTSPLSRPRDLEGLKIRMPAGLALAIFERLGASAVPMPLSEVVSALRVGIIDAADVNNLSEDEQLGLDRAASFCYRNNWWQPGRMIHLTVSKSEWADLPASYRRAFKVACNKAHARTLNKYARADRAALARLKEAGVEVKSAHPLSIRRQARRQATAEMRARAAANPDFKRALRSMNRFQS